MKLIPIALSRMVYNVPYPTTGSESPLTIKDEVILELYFGKDWQHIINDKIL